MTRLPDSEATELVAKSSAMRRVLDLAGRVAPSDATVLLFGESGTGKERLARFIHERSKRRKGPFLAINCGALPESLLESELFGHVKGAFTGASADKKGLFEAASTGTLFLDEIGETSLQVQVRLLRALQEHSVRPVGSTKDVDVDARILAATNRDLESMVSERTFRKDLFYRLKVVPLELPPLRRRREDILPLARQFISRSCKEHSCGPCSLGPDVVDLLIAYDWPGNVRELENAIERAVLLAEGKPRIEPGDLPPEIRGQPPSARASVPDRILTLEEVERQHILATLDRLGGHRTETATALGIGENTLWRKLKSYGMVKARRRAGAPAATDKKRAVEHGGDDRRRH
ncbi:MAG: sigma-54-dependent Fis family transcriptional regulator [Deltaproteobacteria bacterium]|nr:sigma-54-dependent Fis family transcriptional regulator [Deltaproteobacteria bacterium]